MDWNAAWIWHPPKEDMDNFYMHARRAFELEKVPPDARLHITASSLYQLYVNAELVGRGPNPGDPSRYYYDTYDVTRHLRAGRNVIAALCYNYGSETRGILGQNWGRGGLLAELRAPGPQGETLLATDGSWRVLQSPAWKQDVSLNCTLYGDFKEVYDSRQEPKGWLEPDFDDTGWSEPEVLGSPPVEPWTRLVPREIPFLDGEWVEPVNAFWESASVTYSWRDDWEVYHEWNLAPGSGRATPGRNAEVEKTHPDFDPSLILDFGRDVTGYLEITIADSAGGVVDVLYGEDLFLTRVDRFILEGGRQVLRPYNRRTFRYCKLLFPQTPQKVEVERVALKMDTYPVEHRGSFACSDPLLERIWRVGRYTMRMSMLDHFVDCPWRERTLYGGDLWAENLIAHYAFGDPRLTRKCLRQMAAIQFDAGPLPPCGPYSGFHTFYPAWSAYWGLTLLDHYALAGDRELAEELWPNLKRLLDWTVQEVSAEPALIADPAERTDGGFEGWSSAERSVYRPWSNLPFLVLLRRGAELAAELEREGARACTKAAERMAGAVREAFLGEAIASGARGVHAQHTSGQYDLALVLWSGMLDHGEAAEVIRDLFAPETGRINAPFHGLFVAEGLFNYRADDRAVDFIRRYWGEMLQRGATTFWDTFSLSWPAGVVPGRNTSLCHGWAAGPTYCLGARVLGVRPVEPGFKRFIVEPRPGGLDWAGGDVPTPNGPIAARWEAHQAEFLLHLAVPAGTQATLSLPTMGAAAVEVELDGRPVEPDRRGNRCLLEAATGAHQAVLRRR